MRLCVLKGGQHTLRLLCRGFDRLEENGEQFKTRRHCNGVVQTFPEEGQVYFDDGTIEAEDGLEVRFNDVASQISDYDHLRIDVAICGTLSVNIHLCISDRSR